MKLRASFCTGAVALLLLQPLISQAAVTATAKLSNFRVTVIDLTPGDINPGNFFYNYTNLSYAMPGVEKRYEFNGGPQDIHASYVNEQDGIRQTMVIDGFNQYELVHSVSYGLPWLSGIGGGLRFDTKVTLLPYTQLRFEVDYTGSVHRAPGDTQLYLGSTDAGLHAESHGSTEFYDGMRVGTPYYDSLPQDNVAYAQTLTVTITNNRAQKMDAFISGHSSAGVRAPIAPVPEPSSWAMLAGGLLLCVAFRRRNRAG